MTASPNRLTMSVEEYLALDRNSTETRYEYIDGHVTMMAGGTLDHATISLNMASTLRGLLRGSSCRVFALDARVRLSATRYVLPDVTVSCDGRDQGRIDVIQYPHLIVEVLSPSTEDYNRGRKFTYYRECPTIQEYVMVTLPMPERQGASRRYSLSRRATHRIAPVWAVPFRQLRCRSTDTLCTLMYRLHHASAVFPPGGGLWHTVVFLPGALRSRTRTLFSLAGY